MKAPDKIYLERILCSNEVYDNWKPQKSISDDIEYTRTDAFIEKACEYWYQYNRDIIKRRCGEFTVHVEDFRKYLED